MLKRSSITVFCNESCVYSHRVKIVLAEKGVNFDIVYVDPNNPPEDFLDINPYGSLPTLVDRDLMINQSNIIMVYLDERFPHPPLLPVYPVAKAKSRLMIYRIEKDWYDLIKTIEAGGDEADAAREAFLNQLIALIPVFSEMPYFLSQEFSLVDCTIAPVLWRLPQYGIELPEKAEAIIEYANRVFARNSFQGSMSETELEIREFVDEV
ncbi:MAG: stringent starvation protein A [Legionellales bacterium]|jgi:stringent starvation protein A|nr:stringent starvation protein A [Legionellales bacterium]